MTRTLIDRDGFLRLDAAAQETLLRQALLLWLTALELADRNPDAWESAAFDAAVRHLAGGAALWAYDEVSRMMLAPAQRPASRRATDILRVETREGGPTSSPAMPASGRLDRQEMRRRLLRLSAVQPPLDRADARRSVLARTSRHRPEPTPGARHAACAGATESCD